MLDSIDTLAHELGHLMGLEHPHQCLKSSDFKGYPYAQGLISPTATGDSAFYGFDARTSKVMGAADTADLMCYEPKRWPSDWTYSRMADVIFDRF